MTAIDDAKVKLIAAMRCAHGGGLHADAISALIDAKIAAWEERKTSEKDSASPPTSAPPLPSRPAEAPQEPGMLADGIEDAWGVIANAFGGDWSKADSVWRGAAERWRDTYYATNPVRRVAPPASGQAEEKRWGVWHSQWATQGLLDVDCGSEEPFAGTRAQAETQAARMNREWPRERFESRELHANVDPGTGQWKAAVGCLPGERPSTEFAPLEIAFAQAEGWMRVDADGLGYIRNMTPTKAAPPARIPARTPTSVPLFPVTCDCGAELNNLDEAAAHECPADRGTSADRLQDALRRAEAAEAASARCAEAVQVWKMCAGAAEARQAPLVEALRRVATSGMYGVSEGGCLWCWDARNPVYAPWKDESRHLDACPVGAALASLGAHGHLAECARPGCGHERARHISRAGVEHPEPCDEDDCACLGFVSPSRSAGETNT